MLILLGVMISTIAFLGFIWTSGTIHISGLKCYLYLSFVIFLLFGLIYLLKG